MSFSGIIYRSNADGSDVQLPLEELNVSVLILDVTAKVTLTQSFLNTKNYATNRCRYCFQIPPGVVVCGFEMTTSNGRTISGVSKEKDQSILDFESAVRLGRTEQPIESVSNNTFVMSIGSLPARASARVTVVYVTTLLTNNLTDGIHFVFPKILGQRYGFSSTPPTAANNQQTTSDPPRPPSILSTTRTTLTLNIQTYGRLLNIHSPSHTNQITEVRYATENHHSNPRPSRRRTTVRLAMSDYLKEDFVLLIYAEEDGEGEDEDESVVQSGKRTNGPLVSRLAPPVRSAAMRGASMLPRCFAEDCIRSGREGRKEADSVAFAISWTPGIILELARRSLLNGEHGDEAYEDGDGDDDDVEGLRIGADTASGNGRKIPTKKKKGKEREKEGRREFRGVKLKGNLGRILLGHSNVNSTRLSQSAFSSHAPPPPAFPVPVHYSFPTAPTAVVATGPVEFIFLVDRNTSMQGARLRTVKETLVLLLRMLPYENTMFNVWGFGRPDQDVRKGYESLWARSEKYGPESLRLATEYVDSLEANMGQGVDLGAALNAVFASRRGDGPCAVLVLVDGETHARIDETISTVIQTAVHASSSHNSPFTGAGAIPASQPQLQPQSYPFPQHTDRSEHTLSYISAQLNSESTIRPGPPPYSVTPATPEEPQVSQIQQRQQMSPTSLPPPFGSPNTKISIHVLGINVDSRSLTSASNSTTDADVDSGIGAGSSRSDLLSSIPTIWRRGGKGGAKGQHNKSKSKLGEGKKTKGIDDNDEPDKDDDDNCKGKKSLRVFATSTESILWHCIPLILGIGSPLGKSPTTVYPRVHNDKGGYNPTTIPAAGTGTNGVGERRWVARGAGLGGGYGFVLRDVTVDWGIPLDNLGSNVVFPPPEPPPSNVRLSNAHGTSLGGIASLPTVYFTEPTINPPESDGIAGTSQGGAQWRPPSILQQAPTKIGDILHPGRRQNVYAILTLRRVVKVPNEVKIRGRIEKVLDPTMPVPDTYSGMHTRTEEQLNSIHTVTPTMPASAGWDGPGQAVVSEPFELTIPISRSHLKDENPGIRMIHTMAAFRLMREHIEDRVDYEYSGGPTEVGTSLLAKLPSPNATPKAKPGGFPSSDEVISPFQPSNLPQHMREQLKKASIIRLGEQYQLISPHTSFVGLESGRDYMLPGERRPSPSRRSTGRQGERELRRMRRRINTRRQENEDEGMEEGTGISPGGRSTLSADAQARRSHLPTREELAMEAASSLLHDNTRSLGAITPHTTGATAASARSSLTDPIPSWSASEQEDDGDDGPFYLNNRRSRNRWETRAHGRGRSDHSNDQSRSQSPLGPRRSRSFSPDSRSGSDSEEDDQDLYSLVLKLGIGSYTVEGIILALLHQIKTFGYSIGEWAYWLIEEQLPRFVPFFGYMDEPYVFTTRRRLAPSGGEVVLERGGRRRRSNLAQAGVPGSWPTSGSGTETDNPSGVGRALAGRPGSRLSIIDTASPTASTVASAANAGAIVEGVDGYETASSSGDTFSTLSSLEGSDWEDDNAEDAPLIVSGDDQERMPPPPDRDMEATLLDDPPRRELVQAYKTTEKLLPYMSREDEFAMNQPSPRLIPRELADDPSVGMNGDGLGTGEVWVRIPSNQSAPPAEMEQQMQKKAKKVSRLQKRGPPQLYAQDTENQQSGQNRHNLSLPQSDTTPPPPLKPNVIVVLRLQEYDGSFSITDALKRAVGEAAIKELANFQVHLQQFKRKAIDSRSDLINRMWAAALAVAYVTKHSFPYPQSTAYGSAPASVESLLIADSGLGSVSTADEIDGLGLGLGLEENDVMVLVHQLLEKTYAFLDRNGKVGRRMIERAGEVVL